MKSLLERLDSRFNSELNTLEWVVQETLTINPSSWIVFHADTDNSEDIQSLTYKIYNEYLPQSEYKINDKYEIELYTRNGIYLSEIWIPLL